MTLSIARKLALMLALLGVTMMARELGAVAGNASTMAESALSLGFLMLFALLGGKISKLLGGPMITGFIIAGLISGPFILGVVSKASAGNLRLVDDLAFAVIAFYAGGEMRIGRFLPKIKSIFTVIAFIVGVVFPVVFAVIFPLLWLTDILGGGLPMALAGAALVSAIAVTNSPAVVIGVLNETRARGAVAEMTLGVTVFSDVVVVTLFGLAMWFSGVLVGASTSTTSLASFGAMSSIGLSILIGGLAGGALITSFKVAEFNSSVFMAGAAFILAEVSHLAGTNIMLSGIIAGFIVENFSTEGERLMEGLRKSSMPVFALFFSLAGQGLAMDTLHKVWIFAVTVFVIRFLAMRTAVIAGTRLSGADPNVVRYAWTGFIAQAGLSLGLALMVSRDYPGWGDMVKTIIVAVIVMNELIGPLLMKHGLILASEIAPNGEKITRK